MYKTSSNVQEYYSAISSNSNLISKTLLILSKNLFSICHHCFTK